MRLKILSIADVAETQNCCGCGACAYVAPGDIEMVDDADHGRRPIVRPGAERSPAALDALRACPGAALAHDPDAGARPGLIGELFRDWGPVLEVWEGHAADPEIRRMGSSGGLASALALFGVERAGMHGVLHIAARPDVPYLNRTVLSRSRADILAATGSRYAPASPCDGLAMVERAPSPCVFIGKPCDAAALAKTRRLRPALDAKVGVSVAFFCAGAPSTRGTLELLKKVGVEDPASVLSVRYRGDGWPGRWTVRFRDPAGDTQERSLSYEESWGFLTRHRQWRCHVCPDHTGEFADIAVGDPWYRPIQPGEPGESLILVRTEKGRDYLRRAVEAGYVALRPSEPARLPRSQMNLLRVRGHVWGRLLALRLAGAATPRFENIPMFHVWARRLGLKDKAQSVLGTWRRARRKGLLRRTPVTPMEPAPRPGAAPARAGEA